MGAFLYGEMPRSLQGRKKEKYETTSTDLMKKQPCYYVQLCTMISFFPHVASGLLLSRFGIVGAEIHKNVYCGEIARKSTILLSEVLHQLY